MRLSIRFVAVALVLMGCGCSWHPTVTGSWKGAVTTTEKKLSEWGLVTMDMALQQSSQGFTGSGKITTASGRFQALKDQAMVISAGVLLPDNHVSFIAS
jgi:hypothetical protein